MQLMYAGSAIPTSLANSSPDIPTRSLRSTTATDGGACQYSADKTERDAAVRCGLVLQAVSARRRMKMDIFMALSKPPNADAQRCAAEGSGL